MLRQATDADLNQVEEGYQKHFLHEKEHGAFTVFQEGVYPTRADAAKALSKGALHVYEENGDILGRKTFPPLRSTRSWGFNWLKRAR